MAVAQRVSEWLYSPRGREEERGEPGPLPPLSRRDSSSEGMGGSGKASNWPGLHFLRASHLGIPQDGPEACRNCFLIP